MRNDVFSSIQLAAGLVVWGLLALSAISLVATVAYRFYAMHAL